MFESKISEPISAINHKDFSLNKITLLKELALNLFTESDFGTTEAAKILLTVYQHINFTYAPPEPAVRVHKVQGSPYATPEPTSGAEKED